MTLPHILVLFFNDRRVTRIVRIAVRRNRAGGAGAGAGAARRRILHRFVVRVRAGRPAAWPIARNRNRSDARRASWPAPAGTAFITRLSLRTAFGRDSNPPHTGFRRLLHLNELPNSGRPGIRTRTWHASRAPLPSSVHGGMRCRDERGSAAAHQQGFVNPGSRASGTSGAFYLARSVPAGALVLEGIHRSLKLKGNLLRRVDLRRPCLCGRIDKIRYNRIASYPMR
ncbi:hypothetical protein BSLA_02r3325 [Burkholderia stabilis]|nr:hypothetical protein BSLA_02r3325 [Burkholderia stabilis]